MKFPWFLFWFGFIWLQSTVASSAVTATIAQTPSSTSSPASVLQLPPAETTAPSPAGPVPTPTPIAPLLPSQRPIVVVDPGHGGPDPGAVGIGGIYEKDIVLDISLQVAQLLESRGVQAILTRQTDIDLGLQPRVTLANRARATLFVSIHANAISMARPDVNGIETYHVAGSREGQRLAERIQQQLLDRTGMRDRGVKRARFYVLVHTTMPAVLVEVGFVTGRDDAPRLADPATRTLMAEAIVQGILDYLQPPTSAQ